MPGPKPSPSVRPNKGRRSHDLFGVILAKTKADQQSSRLVITPGREALSDKPTQEMPGAVHEKAQSHGFATSTPEARPL